MSDDQRTDQVEIGPAEPTPYPDVNAVLRDLLARLRVVLGERLHGVYLFGSLVTGAFDPGRSDVDVLVVTDAPVSSETFAALQAVHGDLAAGNSPWATEVEVYYLTRAALRRADPSFGEHLKVNRGGGILEPLHRDPGWLVQSHVLRLHGRALVGPDPRTLVDPTSPGDLRRTVAASAPLWLEPLLADPTPLRHSGSRAYLVLTLCRVLYTLAHDDVASKQVAGRWARASVDRRWTDLIDQALAWRKNLLSTGTPGAADLAAEESRELARYVLAQCQELSRSPSSSPVSPSRRPSSGS